MRCLKRFALLGAALTGCGSTSQTTTRSDAQAPPEEASTTDAMDSSTLDGSAAPQPTPDDASTSRKLVFVTSSLYTADLGGLTGADEKCQAAAAGAALPGAYKAWLGDQTTNAEDRLAHASVPYQLVDGTVVADDWSGLLVMPGDESALAHPIDETERGQPPTQQPFTDDCAPTAWTGGLSSRSQLGSFPQCAGWTSAQDGDGGPVEGGSDGVFLGCTNSTSSGWRECCSSYACSMVAPLYCFEQ